MYQHRSGQLRQWLASQAWGCDLDADDEYRYAAFHAASIMKRSLNVSKMLLQHGVDLNKRTEDASDWTGLDAPASFCLPRHFEMTPSTGRRHQLSRITWHLGLTPLWLAAKTLQHS